MCKLAKSPILSKALRVSAEWQIFVIGLTLQINWEAEMKPLVLYPIHILFLARCTACLLKALRELSALSNQWSQSIITSDNLSWLMLLADCVWSLVFLQSLADKHSTGTQALQYTNCATGNEEEKKMFLFSYRTSPPALSLWGKIINFVRLLIALENKRNLTGSNSSPQEVLTHTKFSCNRPGHSWVIAWWPILTPFHAAALLTLRVSPVRLYRSS